MYTQLQRFVATLLLFSVLLQSCHSPNFKLACEETPKMSASEHSPPLSVVPTAPRAAPLSVVSAVSEQQTPGEAIKLIDASSVLPLSYAGSSPQTVRDAIESMTPQRTSTLAGNFVSGAVKQTKVLTPCKDPKLHHAALDQVSLANRVQHEDTSRLPSSHASRSLPPVRVARAELPPTHAASQPQTELAPRFHNNACRALACTSITQPYFIAQGQQVYFQEQAGTWIAHVEDVWGCTQKLPVLCAPDKTPERAIQMLSSKALGQHQYCVHVLEIHQPPWAPRVVYVGVLGLRGGGAVENLIDTTITEAHALPKDAQQACQIDQARDEKKQDPEQSAAIGAQHHHGSIYDNLFASLKHIFKAITIPFDNRPLAPLTHAVHTVCMQLNQCALGTEQLDTSLVRGKKVMRLLEQQQDTPTLDLNERVLFKTLAEKLSCHLRLYQCVAYWSKHFTEAERDAFEAVLIPIFKNRFLCFDTTVQQALLTYWENEGSCYIDILQDAAVVDWLGQSLWVDITQEALANNNTLLRDQFMQSVWRLVQHKQGPTQQKILNHLLWSLRTKQQTYQLNLLTLCKLMEWLPTDGDQALRLLNNEADDWFHTLKVHRITTHLEDFKNRYQEEEFSELCGLLSHFPWDKAIIDSFLSAVDAAQDYTAFKNVLFFLKQYPIEEDTLLHVFHTELPRGHNVSMQFPTPCAGLCTSPRASEDVRSAIRYAIWAASNLVAIPLGGLRCVVHAFNYVEISRYDATAA
jgi:hypothetical protein